jgi:hypothetical protein
MKQVSLLSWTILALVLAGSFLGYVRRARPESPRPAKHLTSAGAADQSVDPWDSATARRWFHNEPSHWRAMLLNH